MQPIQPLYTDEHGTIRFKPNAIVRYLLDFGGIDMNKIAVLPFNAEDRQQFAQLIGYSLGGYGDLSYVSEDDYNIAAQMADHPEQTQAEAAAAHLTQEIADLRNALRAPMARLFGVHPDDLGGE